MAYRFGEPLNDYRLDDEDSVIDSPADSDYSFGEVVDADPFENEPKSSDTNEPDEGGHSLWDIPRIMGKGAAGVAKTASIAFALSNPTEWANRAIGIAGDITQDEALQSYRDYSQKHGVSAKLRQYGETAEDYYDEKLTPAMKKSMEKTILASGEEEGFWGPGIKDPWKIGGMIAESLPSTALSMGSGALITKGLAATGFKNAPKIVQGVLQTLIKKYGVNSVAGAIGGGVGEGVYSGLDNANQAFEEMMAQPQAKLAESKTYQEIFNSLPEKFSTEQKHAYARKILSMATGGFIGALTSVSTGILGAPSGAFLGKLMGGQGGKSFWGNLLKGAFSEGIIEEMPQSGMERLITNFTKKFLVDPNQRLLEGTGEAMAGGAIAGMAMGGGMATVAGREGKKYPIKPELESDAKKILQGDQGDITSRDILLGTDRAEQIRKATEGKQYIGEESVEAEEEAAQYTEEELKKLEPKEAPGDRKGGKQIPGKKPQRKEPKPPAIPKKGEAAPPPSGVLQGQKADEDRQIKIFDAFVKKLTPRQRSTIQDLIDDKKMPIAERMGLAKAELIKPGVERRKEAEREPAAWDKPFRAIHTKAQKQSEAQFMQEAATLLKKRDVGFMDLAKRLGVTIEAGYPIKDKLKTIYARIQSGAEPRKRTQEMSKEELKKELTTDYLTGLGNKHAFEIEDPRKAHVASIDLDSLKYFNDAFGHETGDEMLKNFGAALTPIKGSYHISGDEFIVQNDDTRALQDILENQIPKNLATNPITITLPDGKKIKYEVQFSYGTAKTISDAEERLQAHKAAREVAGERAGRGEIPSGLPGGPTKGERPGVKRKEVPKKELIGGPRRAPMRTTPPPKPKVEAPVKTVSYDIKAEFEYKNRKTLEGLSYIGKLVKRQLLPNGWIRLRYEKIEDFVPRDLWRENLIKTREVARSLGIPFEGLTHAELLGKIDAHEDAPKIPEGAPEGPTNRDLTIRRLGDIGTKIRFKTGYNKEILTITNIGPNGKVSYDGGKIYRSDFEFEAVSPEEIKITARKEIPGAKGGNETKVITPGNPRGYNARYAVVESDDLIPSHNPQTFQKNPDYPEGVQERTYHTDTREQEKVIKNAQHLSNAILLSDDPTPVNGPPIITPGGIVLGGNSRTMSIARAYRGKLGDRYKKALASSASKWGMDSEYITAMDKPVLVRRVYLEKGDIDTLHRMASDFNKSLTQGISQEAEIASMGRNISMDTVEKIGLRMANRDLTLRELLGKKDGLEVLNWLINDDVIPVTDENRFVDRKVNLLNEPGKILIEKALFGSIIDDADLISAAPKALINKIGRALPSLARIKARGDQWDITPEIKDALQLATEAHAADLSIREHLAQGSLFGDKKEYDNTTVGLAELLAKEKQIELAKRFKKFAADAMADVKDQGFLFEPKTFEQAFKDAFDIEVAARAPTPGAAIAPELMSPAEYITHVQAMERKGQDSGIDYAEKVEIEETGETIDRQIDAAGYLNDIDDEIEAYEELLNCIGGGS